MAAKWTGRALFCTSSVRCHLSKDFAKCGRYGGLSRSYATEATSPDTAHQRLVQPEMHHLVRQISAWSTGHILKHLCSIRLLPTYDPLGNHKMTFAFQEIRSK